MRIHRFIKLALTALFVIVWSAGPAFADQKAEKTEKAKAGSEMSTPAAKETPPVESAPPADAKKQEEGAKTEKAEPAAD